MLAKIISGGQTGADRAALDAGRIMGVEIGGFCPRGRLAEDGPIPAEYPLIELSDQGEPVNYFVSFPIPYFSMRRPASRYPWSGDLSR